MSVRPNAGEVVGVRRQSAHDARASVVLAGAALAVLVATQASWKVVAVYGGFELAAVGIGAAGASGGSSATSKTRSRFRTRPSKSPPRWVLARAGPLRKALAGALGVGPIALLVAFPHVGWLVRLAAALIALYIADGVAVPLVEASLAARWERSHGRLFRAVGADDEEGDELYVAHRPVPGA